MVGSKKTATAPAIYQLSYLRKIRKPMVEKQRRERMNNSIDQLKSLIAQTIKQNTSPMTRVDKADILELTVYHLTKLQQQQRAVTLATQAAAYQAGYLACAQEAVSYLSDSKMAGDVVTSSLSRHLNRTMSQPNIAQQNETHFSGQQGPKSWPQKDRLSTPLRLSNSVNSPLPEISFSSYSPIQDGDRSLPEITSSFVSGDLNSSSSVNFSSSSYSSASESSGYSSEYVSHNNDDVTQEHVPIKGNVCADIDLVTIGVGKENEIGRVIKEVPWRPF